MLATILEPILVSWEVANLGILLKLPRSFHSSQKKVYRYLVDDQELEDFCFKSKQLDLSKKVATQTRSYLMTIISPQ